MLQNFLAGFGGVGGACALITLVLKVRPGALDALATGRTTTARPSDTSSPSSKNSTRNAGSSTPPKNTWRTGNDASHDRRRHIPSTACLVARLQFWRAQALIFHTGFQSHPISGWLFYLPLT